LKMLTELNRDKAGPGGGFGPPTYGLRVLVTSGSTSD
jgi:hypothetical protein